MGKGPGDGLPMGGFVPPPPPPRMPMSLAHGVMGGPTPVPPPPGGMIPFGLPQFSRPFF